MQSKARWSRPVSFLPRILLEPRRPFLAVGVAWMTAFLPSILLGVLVGQFFPTLGQPNLPMNSQLALILVAVVSPLLETH